MTQRKIQKYLNKKCLLQSSLLDYLDNNDDTDDKFLNLKKIIDDQKIQNNKHELRVLLKLVLNISNNYHRERGFFNKVDRILGMYKNEIKSYYSNMDIFRIFKSNKRILLFLIDEKILTIDNSIVDIITQEKYQKAKYPEYFFPEIEPFLSSKNRKSIKEQCPDINDELFNEKRKIGENCDPICRLIQEDLLDDFIIYKNANNISFDTLISLSIFETNALLIKKQTLKKNENCLTWSYGVLLNDKLTLIEYATFYGSIRIFNYLLLNDAYLKYSLWIYAMHGKNPEIIHILEEKNVTSYKYNSSKCFYESIKCHHNDIACYLLNNYTSKIKGNFLQSFNKCLKYYNFEGMNNIVDQYFSLTKLCQYGYYSLFKILLKSNLTDVNEKTI